MKAKEYSDSALDIDYRCPHRVVFFDGWMDGYMMATMPWEVDGGHRLAGVPTLVKFMVCELHYLNRDGKEFVMSLGKLLN